MTASVLMCRPTFFTVAYDINPWMSGNCDNTDYATAQQQWENLHALVARFAHVRLIEPVDGLPDMVFTANAALVFGNQAIPSRFRHSERAGEEQYFTQWFADNGFDVVAAEHEFEGAGDALFERNSARLWVGYGHRSDSRIAAQLTNHVSEVRMLELVDPRFYHLDTCFCPLSGGHVMYYPQAFSAEGNALIAQLIAPDKRIEVSEEDALNFACNAVNIGQEVIVNALSDTGVAALESKGYHVHQTVLGEFMKAGGSAKCLTLRLDERMV